MTRFLLGLALVLSAGCNKPSGDDCRKAISNMQVLLGTEHLAHDSDIEGEVRRCKGGSKKKAVECAIAATSIEDLRGCDFMRIPAGMGSAGMGSAGMGSAGMGSGSAGMGSAGMGSADMGSAGMGSAGMGSASDPGSGSAMGSAGMSAGSGLGSAIAAGTTTGSGAATGSGSATGSAAGSGSATR